MEYEMDGCWWHSVNHGGRTGNGAALDTFTQILVG